MWAFHVTKNIYTKCIRMKTKRISTKRTYHTQRHIYWFSELRAAVCVVFVITMWNSVRCTLAQWHYCWGRHVPEPESQCRCHNSNDRQKKKTQKISSHLKSMGEFRECQLMVNLHKAPIRLPIDHFPISHSLAFIVCFLIYTKYIYIFFVL